MKVADIDVEKQTADPTQHRIAKIPVQQRHRAGRNPALESVAQDEVSAVAQALDKRHEGGKIVGVVRIAHNHIVTVGRVNSSDQGRAVTAIANLHDPRASFFAISLEPSVEPLSAIKTSPKISACAKNRCALPMHVPTVSASFKHGMRIDTSTDVADSATISCPALEKSETSRPRLAEHDDKLRGDGEQPSRGSRSELRRANTASDADSPSYSLRPQGINDLQRDGLLYVAFPRTEGLLVDQWPSSRGLCRLY